MCCDIYTKFVLLYYTTTLHFYVSALFFPCTQIYGKPFPAVERGDLCRNEYGIR